MDKFVDMPSVETLREWLSVSEDGVITWIKGHKRGKRAGTMANRGRPGELKLFGRTYVLSRIAYKMQCGEDPGTMVVDHINGNQDDNRLSNLRLATKQQNSWNRAFSGRHNGSRHVYWSERHKSWKVLIGVNRKLEFFGYFKDKSEAETVAERERNRLYGAFKGRTA